MALDQLVRAIADAREQAHRTLFLSHRAFDENAKVVQAGNLKLVCATPLWWDEFARECERRFEGRVIKGNRKHHDGGIAKFQGVEIRRLEYYVTDPDWPIILEAIMRLNLVDFSKVFA